MPTNDFNRRILDHFEDPYHFGQCERPTHAAELSDVGCGDTIVIQLRVVNDTILEAWFDGEGCALSQASASMLMEQIEGKTISEAEQLTPDDVLNLVGVAGEPAHHSCCLTAFETLKRAVDSSLECDDDGESLGESFTGPDLGDEC